jgi:hypothetical protein
MAKLIGPLTWAWCIIVGGLMFTPDGITCIACGPTLQKVLGAISILLGIGGFVLSRRPSAGG